jgi:uncharacterized protein
MLVRFSVENFRSFRDKQELTLVATSLKDLPNSLTEIKDLSFDLLRVAAIYGANASGKTNVLKALAFIRQAVRNSQRTWEPNAKIYIDRFRLDGSQLRPASFEVEFLIRQVRYRYGFVLDADQILEERLFAYPQGKQQLWFERQTTNRFSFGRTLLGENRAIENLTRPNSLFLSAAAQNNHEMLLPVYNWFVNGVKFVDSPRGPNPEANTSELCNDEKYSKLLAKLLLSADLGITGVKLVQEEHPKEMAEKLSKLIAFLRETFPIDYEPTLESLSKAPVLLHRGNEHQPVEFPIMEESAGTVAYFWLLGPAIKTLEFGGVLLVDELDASLHPLLALSLVKLFNEKASNPHGAQLIFNTHDTNLLDNSILRRDQIWFTEKDPVGATHLYPLSDFVTRRNESLKRGYLQGRYGAIPFLGDGHLVSDDA